MWGKECKGKERRGKESVGWVEYAAMWGVLMIHLTLIRPDNIENTTHRICMGMKPPEKIADLALGAGHNPNELPLGVFLLVGLKNMSVWSGVL